MKKICSIMLALVLILALSACSSSKLSEDYSEDEVISRGKEIVELVNTLDYSAINAEMRDDLQETLTAEKLEDALADPIGNAGAFVEYSAATAIGQKSKSTGEDYATAVINCKYENSKIIYTITMDKNMDIVGLNFK